MHKFKEGDRVKCVNADEMAKNWGLKVGNTYEVILYREPFLSVKVVDDAYGLGFVLTYASDFELVTDDKKKE
jgi:hypothetical protein